MDFGVCLIALGYEIYGNYALNLAISLKVYQPNTSITLLTEPQAIQHLTPKEKSLFDKIIIIPESEFTLNGVKQYQRVKLLVYKYTPYKRTFYFDSDNIFLDKKISWLYGEVHDRKFHIGMFGSYDLATNKRTKNTYTYWCEDIQAVCKYYSISYLPQTVSGYYFFEKGEADSIFEEALKVYDDPKAPCVRWANGKPDEFCFNVALAKLGIRQDEFHVFYFDKINGHMEAKEVYSRFWGIATGGNRVSRNLVVIYNRLVDKYCIKSGIETRRYHVNKADVIPERKMF